MACTPSSTTYAPVMVWTRRNTTDRVFHPVGPPVDAATSPLVRASFELAPSSGALLIRPAIRTRNDGITDGASFVNLTTATHSQQLVQPGIEAKNDAGTATELGLATLELDHREV